jgi:hypothetical protein
MLVLSAITLILLADTAPTCRLEKVTMIPSTRFFLNIVLPIDNWIIPESSNMPAIETKNAL